MRSQRPKIKQNTRVKKKLKTTKILKIVSCIFGKISVHLLLKRMLLKNRMLVFIESKENQGSPTFVVRPGRTYFCIGDRKFRTILELVLAHLSSSIEIFPANDIIGGPVEILPMKNGRWNISSYSKFHKHFEKCRSIDRNELYIKFQRSFGRTDF